MKSDLSKSILVFNHNSLLTLRLWPDATQKSRSLGLALKKLTFSGTCAFFRMKVKNAVES